MKIYKVEIKNYRSILDGTFYMDQILAIVGQNNAGKSNVISALDSFFNPHENIEDFIKGKNTCNLPRKKISISITFSDVNRPEFDPFKDEHGQIIIKQEFLNNKLVYYIFKPSIGKYENYGGNLKDFIDFILVPINRIQNIDDETLISGTIVYKAIEESLKKLSEKRDTFSAQLKKAYDYISKHAFNKIAKEINKYYLSSNLTAKIKNSVDIDSTLLMHILGIFIEEKGREFPISYCGSGIQSLFIIGIYQYLSDQLGINYIIALEEPEVNLHPHAQRQFINSIINNNKANQNQIILSTHSPVIIDQLGHTNILLVRKQPHSKRGFCTQLTQLKKTFFTDEGLEEPSYYKFAGFKNSEIFFSSYIIVTESPTDSKIIEQLGERNGIIFSNTNISFISLGGVNNLRYVFALLEGLNIPHCWIVDKDYFLDYSVDNDREKSRDKNGFFHYTNTWTSNAERLKMINKLISKEEDRNNILPLLNSNHTKALSFLEKYNIICMRFNLEMDLFSSEALRNMLFEKLHVPVASRNSQALFVKYKNAIKDPINLYDIVNNANNRNLPNSYKHIISIIKKISNDTSVS